MHSLPALKTFVLPGILIVPGEASPVPARIFFYIHGRLSLLSGRINIPPGTQSIPVGRTFIPAGKIFIQAGILSYTPGRKNIRVQMDNFCTQI
jgi:hypothetical protein